MMMKQALKQCNLNLQMSKTPKSKPLPSQLGFGTIFSDHMLEANWTAKTGWSKPVIKKYEPMSISPAASSLHYGFSAFEGMKAYLDSDKNIRLFRPEENMKRLQESANRVCLPDFDANEYLGCMKELLKVDRSWIPQDFGNSMYIRPTFISTDPDLSVSIPSFCKLYTILSPVGAYYKDGFKDVSLYVSDKYVRAFDGGTGNHKIAGNYAPTLMAQKEAISKGHQQVLWLNKGNISEVGTMNIFFLRHANYDLNRLGERKNKRYQLVTPRLDGTILPGITRDSIIEIVKNETDDIEVIEMDYHIEEFVSDIEKNKIIEVFGTGTAAIVSPVGQIEYNNNTYEIKNKVGNITTSLYNRLLNIQYGIESESYGWSQIV